MCLKQRSFALWSFAFFFLFSFFKGKHIYDTEDETWTKEDVSFYILHLVVSLAHL